MTYMVRSALAAALDTVDGVKGFTKKPAAAKTGDGWVRWAGAERVDGAFETGWQVRILVPDDESAQDAWVADHLDSLIDAISPTAYIDSVELTDSASTACLQFNVRE